MAVVLRNCDSHEKVQDDLKFITFYSNEESKGFVKQVSDAHETSIEKISLMFGHDIHLGSYSLKKHYVLGQLCKIYM